MRAESLWLVCLLITVPACTGGAWSETDPIVPTDGAVAGAGGAGGVGGTAASDGLGGGGGAAPDARVADAAGPQPDGASIDPDAEVSDGSAPGLHDSQVPDDACAAGCAACVQPEDCPAPSGECEVRACSSGQCAVAPAPDTTECDDRDLCTQRDACAGGVCVGGDRIACAAMDECHLGACDPLTGLCTSPQQSDGFVCEDDDLAACTWRDTCNGGACTAGTPITCAAGARCEAGTCVAGPCAGQLGLAGPAAIQAGGYPHAIVSADFNGDDEPDVATANSASDDITVLLALGGGRFAPAESYPAGDQPSELVAEDLNGDGDIDLAVAGYGSGSIRIFFNAGAGMFNAAAPLATLVGPYTIAAGDLNGDDDIDLIVSGGGQLPQLIVYLNDGTGSFSSSAIPLETAAHDIELVDLDDDGARDIVFARSHRQRFDFEGHLAVMLNQRNGTFGAATEYRLGSGTYSITSADFDDDGAQDVAVACGDWRSAFVFLNEGGGTLGEPATYDSAAAYESRDIKAGDFDVDGFTDLVMSNSYNGGQGTAGVFINRGDGTFSAEVKYEFGFSPDDMAVADFDDDGTLDLMSAGGLGNEMVLLLNDGDGRFIGHKSYGSHFAFHSLVADIDADRDLDLVMPSTIDGRMGIARNSGAGNLGGIPDLYPVSAGSSPVAVADFNGDGRVDVAVLARNERTLSIMSNDGSRFSAGPQQTVRPNVSAVAAGDFDHDGRVDLALTDTQPGSGLVTLEILRNQSDGTFAPDGQYTLEAGASILARDLNGDDRLDLVTFGDGIEVRLNDGDGRFAAPSTYLSFLHPPIVTLADLNNDDLPDIVSLSSIHYGNPRTAYVLFNDGEGSFGSNPTGYAIGADADSVATADLDGNSFTDLVFVVSDDRLAVLLNTGTGFQPARYYVAARGAYRVATADLDSDGRADAIVIANDSLQRTLNVHFNHCLP